MKHLISIRHLLRRAHCRMTRPPKQLSRAAAAHEATHAGATHDSYTDKRRGFVDFVLAQYVQ